MAEREKLGLGARLVIGGIAGFVATMAMTSAMRRLHRQLPAKERYPLTPREIVDSALAPPAAVAPDLTLAAHFAWGWSTAEGIRELGKARATIFAQGPDRDVPRT